MTTPTLTLTAVAAIFCGLWMNARRRERASLSAIDALCGEPGPSGAKARQLRASLLGENALFD
jgi:hypothetical protein